MPGKTLIHLEKCENSFNSLDLGGRAEYFGATACFITNNKTFIAISYAIAPQV